MSDAGITGADPGPEKDEAVTSQPSAVPAAWGDDPAVARDLALPAVPWNAFEVVLLTILVVVVCPSVTAELSKASGLLAWYYGGDSKLADARRSLWSPVLDFPFQVAAVPLILFVIHETWPAALGLTWRRFGRSLGLGIAGAVVLTPVVFGLHQGALWLCTSVLGIAVHPHPLVEMGSQNLTRFEWGLLLFSAVVAAPVLEEMMFRGLFQSWTGKTRWGGAVLYAVAGVVVIAARSREIAAAQHLDRGRVYWAPLAEVLDAWVPVLFVLAFLPVLIVVLHRTRGNAAPAIFGTAMLFGVAHVAFWPSPIALFVFGLGLGWLKERTGSLVAPILVHSLLNGVSCAMLMLGLT